MSSRADDRKRKEQCNQYNRANSFFIFYYYIIKFYFFEFIVAGATTNKIKRILDDCYICICIVHYWLLKRSGVAMALLLTTVAQFFQLRLVVDTRSIIRYTHLGLAVVYENDKYYRK